MKLKISHHILLCATSHKASCCDNEIGVKSWERLKEVIRKEDLENPKNPHGIVLRSKVDCLRVCEKGPILLIWPEGTWYKEVTSEKIELIIKSHIINGSPVDRWILKTTELNFPRKNF